MPQTAAKRPRSSKKPLPTRAVFFTSVYDTYVLQHPNARELDDDRLSAHFAFWLETNDAPEDGESFEKFLDFLTEEKGFTSLATKDSTFGFRPEKCQ